MTELERIDGRTTAGEFQAVTAARRGRASSGTACLNRHPAGCCLSRASRGLFPSVLRAVACPGRPAGFSRASCGLLLVPDVRRTLARPGAPGGVVPLQQLLFLD